MAECIVLKGGGGADLDVVTVSDPSDVLAGKVIVDKNGNSLTGTLALSGNASDDQVLAGRSYYSTDPKSKRTGSMPNYSGTPTAIDAIRINNNRFEVAVARGFHGYSWANNGYEYMSYDQVANAIGLTPAKLKKGEWVCGRTGTFEGYVPGAQDLYYRGNNVIGWTNEAGWSFQAGQISVSGASNKGSGTFSTVGKSYLNIEGSTNGVAGSSAQSWTLERYAGGWINVGSVSWNEHGYYTKSINVANAQVAGNFRLTGRFTQDTIFRIWLS